MITLTRTARLSWLLSTVWCCVVSLVWLAECCNLCLVETDAVVEADAAGDAIPTDAPHPRLCHILRWPDYEGYGFNLHAEKGLSGHFIGTVDDGSPAAHSGLRQGDRIVEVNGENVWILNHQVVVQKIKTYPNQVSMLVADPKTLAFYKKRNYKINSLMQNIEVINCPSTNPVHSPPEEQPLTSKPRWRVLQ